MSKMFQKAITMKKNALINGLIGMGIYKKGDQQLYELTLTELEKEYEVVKEQLAKKNVEHK
ncbi:Fur-regulated basic protein A [Evansella caseinilytica]|uniref:Fur-regulated basic protein A n=1 Tax=Evansella caseinilytica TaxID=1503961 RepID=A0A1H3H1Y4_9BACI|nr:Fur-regulated basic protein FbpA [Evansella caseinilytica]SDY09205.1 Fur-regulated basic protein A [Evansella caseinilytica]